MTEIDNILDVEKYIEGLDAVIFDLDDTLYSEKEYIKSGYQKIAAQFHQPEMAGQMWSVFERGGKAIDEVFERKGLKLLKEEALRIYRFHEPDIHLYPGVAEMIIRIRQTKKVGIITDGRPEGQWNKIRALGLEKIINDIVVTDELGGPQYRKPNDISFRIIQNRWKIPFERIMYVGDNPSKDFQAPKQLGMRSTYFRNRDGLYSSSRTETSS